MKKYLIFCLFFCSACIAGHKMVTTESFSEVEVGITEQQLIEKLGKPYLVKQLGNGEKEFEYIERVIVDDRSMESRHYLFILKNGVVTSKKMVSGDKFKPLLERNAYDLQTSYNEEF